MVNFGEAFEAVKVPWKETMIELFSEDWVLIE